MRYLKLFSLLAFALTFRTGKAQTTSGQLMFDNSYVHEIRVTMALSYPAFWDSLTYYYDQVMNTGAEKKYMMAEVSIDGTVMDSIGIRQKGFFSNWGAGSSLKKPLKLSLNEYVNGQKYDLLKKLNLQNGFEDPSVMRDVLAYKLLRDAGIKAPRTSYAKLFINNTYWGLYIVVEELDKTFLKENFSSNNGNLYECISNTDLAWQGNAWSSYTDEMELKTNTSTPNTADFIRFVNVANNVSSPAFRDSLQAVLETDNYLRTLAADVLMLNWDSYYDHGRNFQLYNDPDNNKFNWIPWDYNLAFSDRTVPLIINYQQMGSDKPLVKHCQQDDTLKKKYLLQVCDLLETVFNHTSLDNFITQTGALIRPALLQETSPFFSITDFDNSLNTDIQVNGQFGTSTYKGLKQFISERMQTVTQELQQYNISCSPLSVTDPDTDSAIRLFPNPAGEQVTLGCEKGFSESYTLTVLDAAGRKCLSGTVAAFETAVELQTTQLQPGLYLITLQGESGKLKQLRFVKG